jgi:hypothetical protein
VCVANLYLSRNAYIPYKHLLYDLVLKYFLIILLKSIWSIVSSRFQF